MTHLHRILLAVFVASLVCVAAWADLVMVFRESPLSAPVLATPQAQLVAADGAYNFTPTVTNDAIGITWTAEDLPTGASINSSNGQITGTAPASGTHAVATLTATNSAGSDSVPLVFSVYTSTDTIGMGDSFPFYSTAAHQKLTLTENITTNGTAIALIHDNVSVDLAGYTITYNNAAPISIANASFEIGDAGNGATEAEGWSFANAGSTGAARFAGDFLSNQIYDGDYSIRFSDTTATGYIVSEATVTLQANTTYSLSAMFEYGGQGTDDNPGVVGYVSIVGTGGEATVTASKSNTNYRGIQLVETVFTTGAGTPTYNVRVGITGHVSAAEPYYIDDVKIQQHMNYGVVAGPKSFNASQYPGVTSYGTATNSTITGGNITQGQGSGSWCHAILVEYTGLSINGVTATVSGQNSSCVWQGSSGSYNFFSYISGNTFTSNVSTITSRDNFHGAVLHCPRGKLWDNQITNGPHAGIFIGTSPGIQSEVWRNTVQLTAKYTNGFAILGGSSSHVHHNTINCGTDPYGARGIGISSGAEGNPAKCHDNVVYVQQIANNQEYEGTGGEAYGIQAENSSYTEIYNNTVFAYGTNAKAHALRIGPYNGDIAPTEVSIHDNTLHAGHQGESASNLKMLGNDSPLIKDFSGISFYDNTFVTNDAVIGGTSYADITLTRTHIRVVDAVATPQVFQTGGGAGLNSEIVFLDTTFEDASSRTHFDNGTTTWYNNPAIVETTMRVDLAWTTDLTIQGDGTPLTSTAVSIQDQANTEVFSGTTDGAAKITPTIVEQSVTGSTQTDHNPHAVIVSGYNEGAITVGEANETATINLTSP